jgi:hypothetical protein
LNDHPVPRTGRIQRALGGLAIVVGLALLAGFGIHAWRQYQFAQRVATGQVLVETVRGWMTLSYVARMHGVPESRLREALGVPATGGDERSLREWIDVAGIDPEEGRRRIESVILRARAAPQATP